MAAKPETSLPSERSFGLLFAGVAGVAAVWLLWHGHALAAGASVAAGIALLLAGLLAPHFLALPNRLWFRFGMLLNAIVSPIVLGAIFFLVITPVGLIRRLGSDPLRLKVDPQAETYWIARETSAIDPSSFKNQF